MCVEQGGAQEVALRGLDKLGGIPMPTPTGVELAKREEDEEPDAQEMGTQDVNAVLKNLEKIGKVCARRFPR